MCLKATIRSLFLIGSSGMDPTRLSQEVVAQQSFGANLDHRKLLVIQPQTRSIVISHTMKHIKSFIFVI